MACPANQSRRSILYARFRLKSPFKGAVLWSTSCKTNMIFFYLVHQWRKFLQKCLGFDNLIMTIHKNSYKRQEGGKLNYNFKKGREDVFSTTKVALKLSLIAVCSASQNAFLLFFSGYLWSCVESFVGLRAWYSADNNPSHVVFSSRRENQKFFENRWPINKRISLTIKFYQRILRILLVRSCLFIFWNLD